MRHCQTLLDFSAAELRQIITRAIELKAMQHRGERYTPLMGKTLAMIFTKSSTRTRVSFEVGMTQFGGNALFLSPRDTQLGRGEPIADTARVLSGMVDAIMLRNDSQADLEELAKHASIPVINGLTDRFHPCQILADLATWQEHRGSFKHKTVAWIGDGNNVCHSWINAAHRLDFHLNIACPAGFEPEAHTAEIGGDDITIMRDPHEAAHGADLIVTDVWASMGQEEEQKQREKAFAGFQVDDDLMKIAHNDALFMHCLPAHRGEEVTASVIDGPQSVVWDEAEYRLHAQKALLEFLLP